MVIGDDEGNAPTAPRVLIADDEVAFAFEIEAVLRDAGFHPVGPALGLGEMLTILEQDAVDAALIDAGLLAEDPASALAALKARSIPFLLMTGSDSVDLPAWVWADSAYLVLKPCTSPELVSKLRTVIAVSRSEP
jgi:DNA-binding response OmpR family regulator